MLPDTLVALQPSGGGTDYLPFLTALAGGLIGLFGPWLTSRSSLEAAKAQLRATTLTTTRIRWADELRGELAQLGAECLAVVTDLARGDDPRIATNKLDTVNQRIMKCELLLDTTYTEAQALQSKLDTLSTVMTEAIDKASDGATFQKVDATVKDVIECGRSVISKEWSNARASV